LIGNGRISFKAGNPAEQQISGEGHGFSRAANDLAPDGFTACGKNSVLYQGTTSVGP
jgi:hypothetical protein